MRQDLPFFNSKIGLLSYTDQMVGLPKSEAAQILAYEQGSTKSLMNGYILKWVGRLLKNVISHNTANGPSSSETFPSYWATFQRSVHGTR